MESIKIGLLGLGTVGTGVYRLLEKQAEEIKHKAGVNTVIDKVLVRNISKTRTGIPTEIITDNPDDILNNPDIKIVVEVMGGMEPAYEYIKSALMSGKNVVTANKDLMAVKGGELMELAAQNGCDLLFEAAVAGGIPIIRPLKPVSYTHLEKNNTFVRELIKILQPYEFLNFNITKRFFINHTG